MVIMEHRKFVMAQNWLPYTIIMALLYAATVVCEYQCAELEGHACCGHWHISLRSNYWQCLLGEL